MDAFFEWIKTNEVIINIILNFFLAIGTIGAVIISLYLANRKEKDKLKYHFNSIKEGIGEGLYIYLTNLEMHDIIITTVFIKNPFLNYFFGLERINSEKQNKILEPGEEVLFKLKSEIIYIQNIKPVDHKCEKVFKKIYIETTRGITKINLKRKYYIYKK